MAVNQFDEHLKTLGLSRGYTLDDLKKAHRKYSRTAHPDMGGSSEAMQKVNAAFEYLKGSAAKTTAPSAPSSGPGPRPSAGPGPRTTAGPTASAKKPGSTVVKPDTGVEKSTGARPTGSRSTKPKFTVAKSTGTPAAPKASKPTPAAPSRPRGPVATVPPRGPAAPGPSAPRAEAPSAGRPQARTIGQGFDQVFQKGRVAQSVTNVTTPLRQEASRRIATTKPGHAVISAVQAAGRRVRKWQGRP